MSRRLNITITDSQYDYLTRASESTSLSVAELIRRALDARYPASATGATSRNEFTIAVWRPLTTRVGRRGGLRLD